MVASSVKSPMLASVRMKRHSEGASLPVEWASSVAVLGASAIRSASPISAATYTRLEA